MFWIIVAAMAVVVGGAALVALGGGGTLPDAVHDRIAARLPQDRPLSRHDVDEIRLPMALRGYRMDEVDDVLDRLGAELAYRDSRIAELEAAAAVRDAVEAGTDPQPGLEPLPGLEDFARIVSSEPVKDAAETAAGPKDAAAEADVTKDAAEQSAAAEADAEQSAADVNDHRSVSGQ
ncbi:DivIVA domain-containing protein [Kitasatospora sp. MAP5-34]|uniref:DivIVA domain-containing protein n=1 Tax=Kitasatospora sp. MAP5-34 TaxID=3035102 RepID=UPI002474E02B|nr:DivIVA domain-containing protein [Kitasatospora sp. MAP5-34]MDH6575510.1 DivIVA domain-containing protein [Kitasatospora sp. MAP5-34]